MLTDTAGQEEYRGLWATSNLKSDAFLLVYDITNPLSLEALDHFVDMIDMETDQRLDAGEVPPVKFVAGNKCDLSSAREISSQQGLEWARQKRCGFMETSAREMVNIEETFARKLMALAKREGFALQRQWRSRNDMLTNTATVIVRRVVEARRLQATGGIEASLARAQPGGQMNEKHLMSSESEEEKKPGFFSRLCCF
jgi:GTPase KRas